MRCKNTRHSPCLALYPNLRALSGLVGLGARWRPDSWRYCQHRTRRRNLITSDCFFLQSSCMYLYAPMMPHLQHQQSGYNQATKRDHYMNISRALYVFWYHKLHLKLLYTAFYYICNCICANSSERALLPNMFDTYKESVLVSKASLFIYLLF